jgi:hypothetical protein
VEGAYLLNRLALYVLIQITKQKKNEIGMGGRGTAAVMRRKLEGYNRKLISRGGRHQLINSVMSSVLVHFSGSPHGS